MPIVIVCDYCSRKHKDIGYTDVAQRVVDANRPRDPLPYDWRYYYESDINLYLIKCKHCWHKTLQENPVPIPKRFLPRHKRAAS